MTRTPGRHRLTTFVAACAVASTGLMALPAQADASVTSAEVVDSAAAYLVTRLVDGDHLEGDFGPQYGPTADVAYALLASGAEAETLDAILAYLTTEEAVGAYVHGAGFDRDDAAYVGATAKLGLLVTLAGLDPHDVGGTDLVATLESLEAESGRYEDRSDFGNFANIFGQSFGVLFLEAVEGTDASPAALDALEAAQCDDGGFPESFDAETCTGNPDATGLAIQAMSLQPSVNPDAPHATDKAAKWLQTTRSETGTWGDPANTNSTGYAGMGLLSANRDVAATQGYLAGIQNDDGGLPISSPGDSDPFATAQALPLLASSSFWDLLFHTSPTPDGVERLSGEDRIATAIATSREIYPRGGAGTVVLTRSDEFADGLAGTPLAAALDGPLLLTRTHDLPAEVLAEIQRLLPAGAVVYLLGGESAIAPEVATALTDAGFTVTRLAGEDRYATAVRIAQEMGDPDVVIIATGLDFPDALTAGAAAGHLGGVVVLSAGAARHDTTTDYLVSLGEIVAYSIGGPAATAYPEATAIVGADRDATAVAVAERLFPSREYVGIARRDVFADALGGAVQAVRLRAPLLLTGVDVVPTATQGYLCEAGPEVFGASVYGGESAIGPDAFGVIGDRLAGAGC